MEFLPRTLGTRPRLACEVRAEGVVAARADDASAVLAVASRVIAPKAMALPQLHPADPNAAIAAALGVAPDSAAKGAANIATNGGRAATVAAVRKALEAVSLRTRDVNLVVPDSAVRVLLLDFDALPAKPAEALPVVRFRLKKLLPFDADDAAVSYQVMSSSKDSIQVMAVAMPREVLQEYESIVREAGFEPGAVLPSTLATLAGLAEGERPTLVVNAGREGVTTAIVRGGVLLLHRTVDLSTGLATDSLGDAPETASAPGAEEFSFRRPTPAHEVAQAVSVAAAYFEDTLETPPSIVLAAGTLGAEALVVMLDDARTGMGPVAVQEMVDRHMLGDGAASAGSQGGIPLGWLAGVHGALSN